VHKHRQKLADKQKPCEGDKPIDDSVSLQVQEQVQLHQNRHSDNGGNDSGETEYFLYDSDNNRLD
jgi:hypothetical protein